MEAESQFILRLPLAEADQLRDLLESKAERLEEKLQVCKLHYFCVYLIIFFVAAD